MAKSYSQMRQEGDSKSKRKKIRKAFSVAVLGLVLALYAFVDDSSFDPKVNNTDLGSNGTHERLHNVVYWANNSPVAVYLTFHVIGTGSPLTVDSNLSINNVVVLDRDFSTSAAANIHEHFSYYTIVPEKANYSVTNSSNVYSVEWREYKIRG